MSGIHLLGTVLALGSIVNAVFAWVVARNFRRLFARTDALKQVADITNSNVAFLHNGASRLEARVTSIEDEFPFKVVDATKRAKMHGML